jgi:hypothetical protein
MRAAPFCPQRLNKVYIIGSTFTTHIGGVELLGRTLMNVLVFAHGPLTRWTPPAHGILLNTVVYSTALLNMAVYGTVLLNTVVCGSILHRIIKYSSIRHRIVKYGSMPHLSRYYTLHVIVRGMRIWPPNAAKCCKNAGKFFSNVV